MTTNPWKTTAPDEPGLYIASAERKARYIRYWTGVHWTAPLAVHDLHLTDRIPTAEGPAAATWKNRPIEWLEKVTIDADGFISWGRMLDTSPVAPDLLVEFRMADLRCSTPVPASLLTWGAGGSITAYRVVRDDADLPTVDLIDKAMAKSFAESFAPGRHLKEALAANDGGIGDITSTAKGSGARFNAGKADLALVPLCQIAESYTRAAAQKPHERRAADTLHALGRFQQTHDTVHLYRALACLGLENWQSCAKVFTYGAKKYASWNWAKGMAWSVPLACAARHIVFGILAGEETDAESGELHAGHVFANIVMLLAFFDTYVEGNDLPTQWLDAA